MESRAKTEEFEFRNLKENLNFKPQFWSHTWDLVKPTLTYDQVLEMLIKLTYSTDHWCAMDCNAGR